MATSKKRKNKKSKENKSIQVTPVTASDHLDLPSFLDPYLAVVEVIYVLFVNRDKYADQEK